MVKDGEISLKLYSTSDQESERKQGFNPSWKATFEWLEYHVTNNEGKMFSSIRRKYDHPSSSVGNQTFELEKIKVHTRSESHRQSKLRFDATKKPENMVAHKMLMKLNQKTVDQLKILFISAHALAKHGHPYPDLQWLCTLDEAKGLKIASTYCNDKR